MKLTKIVGVTLAVLLVATSAATALPGNAPAQSDAADNAAQAETTESGDDERAVNESETDDERADAARNGADRAGAADERRGPPTDMPAGVPDFVGEIHTLIQQKLDGAISDLGAQISDVTPDDADDAEQSDDEQSENDQSDADEQTDTEQSDTEQSDTDSTQSDSDSDQTSVGDN